MRIGIKTTGEHLDAFKNKLLVLETTNVTNNRSFRNCMCICIVHHLIVMLYAVVCVCVSVWRVCEGVCMRWLHLLFCVKFLPPPSPPLIDGSRKPYSRENMPANGLPTYITLHSPTYAHLKNFKRRVCWKLVNTYIFTSFHGVCWFHCNALRKSAIFAGAYFINVLIVKSYVVLKSKHWKKYCKVTV